MADVITRLKLESGEYDSKIKRAVTGLQRMENECRKVGGTLAILEKDQKQYVESLGRMQTVSTSVRGKIGELSNAYVELRSQYNRLTQEEKKGDFGKALSASLDQLKTRINDSKKELNDINAELGNTKQTSGATSQALKALAGKFGLNVSALTKLGGALAVAGTALKVAKDAFFQTESNIDEWGRTVKGAEGAYDVFLQTLNNGNWSNFFQNLSTAVQGARDLYNALDKLGSIKGNNQAAIAIVQQQIAQLRLLKQQGKNVDDQLKAATQRLAQLQGQAVSAGKTAGKKTVQQTIRNGVNSMGGAAVSDKSIQAAVGGILTKGQAEFNKYARTVSQFENWSKAQRTVTRSDMDGNRWTERVFDMNLLSKPQQRKYKLAKAITNRETEIQKGIALYAQSVQEGTANAREEFKGNRYALQGATGGGSDKGDKGGKTDIIEEVFPEGSMKDLQRDMQELKKAQDLVTSPDEWQKYQQQIDAVTEKMNTLKGVVKQTATASVKAEKPTALNTFANSPISETSINAYLNALQQGVAQSDIGSGVQAALAAKLTEGDQLSQALQMAMDAGVQGADLTEVAQKIKDKMLEGGTMDAEQLQEFLDEINKYIENSDFKLKFDIDTKSITDVAQTNIKDAEKMTQNWTKASSAINTVSSAMQSLEDPAAKVIGTIAQAIATIALSYAEASLMAAKNPLNAGWGWIAFAATGAATMISSIAAIHSATGYAQGGIVDGSNGGFVGGSQFSGDQVGNVRLNSGELVLSRSQQFNLASQLEGESNQGTTPSRPYVSGEQIYLGLNNYLRRSGRGEIVTSR